jgi:hypothetical protein
MSDRFDYDGRKIVFLKSSVGRRTIGLDEETGFINAEGIRIGDLIIGSKGKIKITHIRGMRSPIHFESDIFTQDINAGSILANKIDVVGDVVLLGADCAEEFDIAGNEDIEPGTVLVIGDEGRLQPSEKPFDKRVAGVVSGGKDYHPGIILDKKPSDMKRLPIALTGKTYCKVDARYSPIELGDLLTTSSVKGHAMKADDPFKAFGSVIGKALCPMEAGHGIIPILVALQ